MNQRQPHGGRWRIVTWKGTSWGTTICGVRCWNHRQYDHASHDGVLNRIVHETCDDKNVNPCITAREDGQLGTIALIDHNSRNQQMNNYPKLLKDT
jgi:hypothetical protein